LNHRPEAHVSLSLTRLGRVHLLRCSATLVLLAGYGALAAGSVTLAPMLLVVGYVVLVPLALLAR
jgi:hypothetical protein